MKRVLAVVTATIIGLVGSSVVMGADLKAPSKPKISAKERRKTAEKPDQPLAAPKSALKVGDVAPAIVLAKTVKGEPIVGFDRDHVYVVEFWATWCGPCRETIPHLTELAAKFGGKAKFLGVSVSEADQAAVEPFVAKMGDKMKYTVAMDKVPASGKAAEGVMNQTWMKAAGRTGIPSAFVVDSQGKIAWIGHPGTPEMEAKIAELTGELNGAGLKGSVGGGPATPGTPAEKPATGTRSAKESAASPKSGAAKLKVGDAAPAISLGKTVKGEEITVFDRKHVYVVEFWATWCGPCRETIPHLTELAKKFSGKAKFLGVSVAEKDSAAVEPFVATMGDKMRYTVATDRVPSGGKAADGFMLKAWLQAAGLDGIPTAFVISAEGKVAWIGNPASAEMEAKIADLTGKLSVK